MTHRSAAAAAVVSRYSPNNSAAFTKQQLRLTGPGTRLPVLVEATEYGDVLALGRLPYTQGVEVSLLVSAPPCLRWASLAEHKVPSVGWCVAAVACRCQQRIA